MKFVSKNNNLRIILEHGIPPEPITGRLAIPALHIKFENGVVISRAMGKYSEEEIIEKMKRHNGFGSDFISAENENDPYESTRKQNEPEHDIQEIKYGQIEKTLTPAKATDTMTVDQRRMFNEMVEETAKKIAIPLAKDIAKKIIVEMEEEREKEDVISTEKVEEVKEEVREEVKEEVKKITPKEVLDSSKESFVCDTCGFIGKSKRSLAAHRRFDKDCISLRK